MGLRFPPDRIADLERGLAAAAAELGLNGPAPCADLLLTGSASRDDVQTVASHLTVGETYFYRDTPLFDRLAETVIPVLVRAREAGDRRLRLWSAGCCTGEEAYSLAILLHLTIPDLARWNATIIGTDINARFLHKAMAGTYSVWSFRGAPQGFRERWFKRTADGRYTVVPEVKRLVTFVHGNLVEDAFPTLATGTNAMDLILCRNVLMYFAPPQARSVVDKLYRSLVPGGWLAVSPAEVSRDLFAAFAIRNYPGATLFAKEPQHRPPVREGAPAPLALTRTADTEHSRRRVTAGRPVAGRARRQPAPAPQRTVSRGAAEQFAEARALANDGQLGEALVACDAGIRADRVAPAGYYLRALIALELGRDHDARESLQRALYLAPDLVAAHFTLGNLAAREGRSAESRRHLGNAQQLLGRCRPDEPVAETDGLTAASLDAIIRDRLVLEYAE